MKKGENLALRLLDWVDRRVPMWLGVLLIQNLHILAAWWVGRTRLHWDAGCHYAWMKMTHRIPLQDWYDNIEYTHLDYPPLAAYMHYLLGYLMRYIVGPRFMTTGIYNSFEFTATEKWGMRLTVFLCNSLTYNTALIFIVCNYWRALTTSRKLLIIFMYQFLTYYFLIDFMPTQINGPHFALLLLSLYSGICHHFKTCTVLFTLATLFKHSSAMYAIPIGIYIACVLWRQLGETKNSVN